MKIKVTCKYRAAYSHVKGFWSAGRHFPVGETVEIDVTPRELEQLEADAPHVLEIEPVPDAAPVAPKPVDKAKK